MSWGWRTSHEDKRREGDQLEVWLSVRMSLSPGSHLVVSGEMLGCHKLGQVGHCYLAGRVHIMQPPSLNQEKTQVTLMPPKADQCHTVAMQMTKKQKSPHAEIVKSFLNIF